jgi:outer membrane lipoprotein-sorting protein
MKISLVQIFIALSFLFVANVNGQDDAGRVLTKMDNTMMAVEDKVADIEMEMTNLNTGKGNVKRALFMQKGADKKIFRYTFPKSDEGIATLTLPGEVYLYLPMFKKPKKITNMAQSNTFNKSDFSLSDAGLMPYAKFFAPEMLNTTASDYVLDLIPKQEIDNYSHLIVTINKKYYYPEKIEYFDKKKNKIKEAIYKYQDIDGYWIADVVTMTDLKKNHKSTLTMTNVKVNQGLTDEDFTVEKLVQPKK